ncbi:MAG: hypothetical protein PUC11_02460 [Elusimicrobia bacterium]|nr:hypothetical protein [Elusimicrobiota bacterium]
MSFTSLLNDACTVYARVESVDEETGEQIFAIQKLAENVPCAFQNGSGNVDRAGRLITGSNTDRIYLLPLGFKLEKMTHIVEVRGGRYRISEIKDMGGRKRCLLVDLERTELDE